MATAHIFPANLVPTSRSFVPGVYPQSEFQGLNGAVTTIQFGVKSVDCMLSMTFANISDDNAWLIMDNYNKVMSGRDEKGNADYVDLEGQMKGIQNVDMSYQISQNPVGNPRPVLRWRYSQPPEFTSVFPGRTTVSVNLRGYLEGASSA
jgi:hypothetical protein